MTFLAFLARLFARAPAPVSEPPKIPVVAVGEGPDWVAILRAVGFADPVKWAEAIAAPAARRGIHAGKRAAAFAATIAHESDGGRRMVESLNYSPAGLRGNWPHRFSSADAERWGYAKDAAGRITRQADQRAIAERAYGGRMGNGPEGAGDGFKYRGRGLIQSTGRDAYAQAGAATGLPLVQSPDLAIDPDNAAEIAAWVWAAWKGCNALADAGDVEGWRRAINGGTNGLDDVRQRYQAALAVI
jgi:putative chitinase